MQLDDTLESYLRRVADFHGCFQKAPGIVIGCHMVEYAMELLGDVRGTLNAVVETRVCLADCVQVMTGCTLGNKHLKLHDHIGKYACTLYDRDTKRGVRVYLDVTKIDRRAYPELHAFHTRQRDPKVLTDMTIRKTSGQRVVDEFLLLKRTALSFEHVTVQLPAKEPMLPSVPCRLCGEPFLTRSQPGEAQCPPGCGESYYRAAGAAAAAAADGAAGERATSSCRGE
jgi:formylmethanofuran dehydrogenase subunit E